MAHIHVDRAPEAVTLDAIRKGNADILDIGVKVI